MGEIVSRSVNGQSTIHGSEVGGVRRISMIVNSTRDEWEYVESAADWAAVNDSAFARSYWSALQPRLDSLYAAALLQHRIYAMVYRFKAHASYDRLRDTIDTPIYSDRWD